MRGLRRPVKVVISPMGRNMMAGAGGQASGLVPDFPQQVATRTGCRFHFNTVPRARAQMLFPSGEADPIPAATRTPEQEQPGTFVHMYNSRAMRSRRRTRARRRAWRSAKAAFTSVSGMQPAQIGIYLNRQSLPAADLALLREVVSRLIARGD